MKLELPEGQRFSLHVERYEFPDEELGPTEDNPADEFDAGRFLVVTISCSTSNGTWTATQPEMKTTELERLANWLETVSKGQPSLPGVYFTERDLEISVDETAQLLNVYLHGYFLPPWLENQDLTITFPLNRIDLRSAIASIRAQLVKFPGRPMPDQSR